LDRHSFTDRGCTVLGLALDEDGRLFVLEGTVGQPAPTPGFGRVLETLRRWQGKFTVVVDGVSLPTAMTFGPLQMVLDSPLAWVKS
jgi:hypothetical protein